MKKIFQWVIGLISVLAIGLCVALAIKTPTVFTDLIGINTNQNENSIRDVPYFANFDEVSSPTNNTGYMTQSFSYDNQTWYSSYGANVKGNATGFYLGWNSNSVPTYTSYSYLEAVMKNITLPETQVNYSYLLMDFDFNKNHQVEFSFNMIDSLIPYANSKVYLIGSTNSGTTWNVLDTKANNQLSNSSANILTFTYTVDNLVPTLQRYGLVIVSENNSARLKLGTFYAKRISLS